MAKLLFHGVEHHRTLPKKKLELSHQLRLP
jgi:hypothetical protein